MVVKMVEVTINGETTDGHVEAQSAKTISAAATPAPEPTKAADQDTESSGSVYYANCDAARAAGAAPLSSGDPGYSTKLDRDRDGVSCDS